MNKYINENKLNEKMDELIDSPWVQSTNLAPINVIAKEAFRIIREFCINESIEENMVPERTAKWFHAPNESVWRCSECLKVSESRIPGTYCLCCGAKMDLTDVKIERAKLMEEGKLW